MRSTTTLLLILFSLITAAQDTFSIVAVDPETGEVGSAGASCVDLAEYGIEDASFLGVLMPGSFAMNTQAYYDSTNQANGRLRLEGGMTPAKVIEWLHLNDVNDTPEVRQYGIVMLVDGEPLSAAYTGDENMDYAGHITGETYSIQGNILLGPEVLEKMEENFNSTEGTLAEKLMAALEGAKIVGADSRCADNESSSLFAYIKVASLDDEIGEPSFKIQVITKAGDKVEPITELRKKFDERMEE
ncbi:MAG: DUF1028 domain-containing protein [Flavobacteriia bacterium]|nr:DUF1028 domain-containing protein [Flavobacteriia bacterium]